MFSCRLDFDASAFRERLHPELGKQLVRKA
jgi:hypothetical protein